MIDLSSNLLLRLLNAPATTWLVLTIPALPMLADIGGRERYYSEIMYESGLLSVQLLVLALVITPLMQLSKKWKPGLIPLRLLLRRRRYIGVAAFGYAGLHTFFYLRETGSLELAWLELSEIDLAVGWLAMIPMLVLALTSNNYSVRLMGKMWKMLQRAAYPVAGLTVLHWYLIGQFQQELVMWFAPVLVLELPRIFKTLRVRFAYRNA